MSIGTVLKTARKVLALSRHALAKMVNIDPRHLASIENSGRLLVFSGWCGAGICERIDDDYEKIPFCASLRTSN